VPTSKSAEESEKKRIALRCAFKNISIEIFCLKCFISSKGLSSLIRSDSTEKNAELALASDLLVFYTELLKRFLIIETQEEME